MATPLPPDRTTPLPTTSAPIMGGGGTRTATPTGTGVYSKSGKPLAMPTTGYGGAADAYKKAGWTYSGGTPTTRVANPNFGAGYAEWAAKPLFGAGANKGTFSWGPSHIVTPGTPGTWSPPAGSGAAASGPGTSSSGYTSKSAVDYSTSPFAKLQPGLQAAGESALAGGQQMYQTGMDPQNALRGREEQRLQDAARVNSAARGITTSPYGAGVENQAMSNFGIDWQNTQLGRQQQGMAGLATGTGVAQGLYSMGGTTNASGTGTNTASTLEQQRMQAETAGIQQQTAASIAAQQRAAQEQAAMEQYRQNLLKQYQASAPGMTGAPSGSYTDDGRLPFPTYGTGSMGAPTQQQQTAMPTAQPEALFAPYRPPAPVYQAPVAPRTAYTPDGIPYTDTGFQSRAIGNAYTPEGVPYAATGYQSRPLGNAYTPDGTPYMDTGTQSKPVSAASYGPQLPAAYGPQLPTQIPPSDSIALDWLKSSFF